MHSRLNRQHAPNLAPSYLPNDFIQCSTSSNKPLPIFNVESGYIHVIEMLVVLLQVCVGVYSCCKGICITVVKVFSLLLQSCL